MGEFSSSFFFLYSSFLFFLWGRGLLGFEIRASGLLGICSVTWATFPALWCFSYFSVRVSWFCLVMASDCNLPIYISLIAGVTSINCQNQLVWDGFSTIFFHPSSKFDPHDLCIPSITEYIFNLLPYMDENHMEFKFNLQAIFP